MDDVAASNDLTTAQSTILAYATLCQQQNTSSGISYVLLHLFFFFAILTLYYLVSPPIAIISFADGPGIQPYGLIVNESTYINIHIGNPLQSCHILFFLLIIK